MLSVLREPSARAAGAVLAALALALTLLMPAGFMPGSSLAQPIVLCDGQGPMPAMARPGHAGHHGPGALHQMPGGMGDHGCPFAGSGAPPLAPPLVLADLAPLVPADAPRAARPLQAFPGRGLAAPPPPAHAPPYRSA